MLYYAIAGATVWWWVFGRRQSEYPEADPLMVLLARASLILFCIQFWPVIVVVFVWLGIKEAKREE
jgi:hypothetical protein